MQEQFKRLSMPARRWPAVDGNELTLETLEALVAGGELTREAVQRLLLPDDQKAFGLDLTLGAIGCALSHMQIWLHIMRRHGQGEWGFDERVMFLVVEDDCEFLPGFSPEAFMERLREVPSDWQLLFLGGVDALGLQQLLEVSPGVRRSYNGSRETTGYVINVEGVREALHQCFPLTWQIDTQLTLQSKIADEIVVVDEEGNYVPLAYPVKPMGYLFWPPFVEQNKEDFRTDVQKDEHPRYLWGRNGTNSYTVRPEVQSDLPERRVRNITAAATVALSRSYALVGSWDEWAEFVEFRRTSKLDTTFIAEVQAPPGQTVEFQIVRDLDWQQRLFPDDSGGVEVGFGPEAHGRNWEVEVPIGPPRVLHVELDPTTLSLEATVGEHSEVALARSYAIVGSWNEWGHFKELQRDRHGGPVFTGSVNVPPDTDVEFQLICNEEWNYRIFPGEQDGAILGPSGDAHGRNWGLEAWPEPSILYVHWDPTGNRSLICARDRRLPATKQLRN